MTSPSIDDILSVVDDWFAEEVQSPPLSYHTECYNQMYAARSSLRNRLAVAITGEPLAPPAPPLGEEAGEPGGEGPGEPEAGSEGSGGTDQGAGTPSKPKPKPGS